MASSALVFWSRMTFFFDCKVSSSDPGREDVCLTKYYDPTGRSALFTFCQDSLTGWQILFGASPFMDLSVGLVIDDSFQHFERSSRLDIARRIV